jgi:hypothetical protein
VIVFAVSPILLTIIGSPVARLAIWLPKRFPVLVLDAQHVHAAGDVTQPGRATGHMVAARRARIPTAGSVVAERLPQSVL